MSMKIPDDKLGEIENTFKAMHEETFKGEGFVFGPVTVKQTVDHYGEDNLDFVVVYDGEYCGLDAHKLNMVSLEMASYLRQLDFHNIPTEAHIHKSEYAEWLELSRLQPWEKIAL